MTQEERLDRLLAAFKEDSVTYRDLEVGEDAEEKRVALRSLMNIRMPKPLPMEVLTLQDEYLKERNGARGVVTVADIPTIGEQGSAHPFADKLSIWQGDITRLAADAIVNAANAGMLGCFRPMHTCIDNAIHTFAGVELRQECWEKMAELKAKYGEDYEQPTAVPMLTDAYNLPAKKVIHIVGPIVELFVTTELEEDLRNCYTRTLDLCRKEGLRSVAFCCISTGVFRFPQKRAAEIAVETVTEWLRQNEDAMDRIIFNVFKDEDKEYYESELF